MHLSRCFRSSVNGFTLVKNQTERILLSYKADKLKKYENSFSYQPSHRYHQLTVAQPLTYIVPACCDKREVDMPMSSEYDSSCELSCDISSFISKAIIIDIQVDSYSGKHRKHYEIIINFFL